jgi:hypothetical protein
MMHTIRLLDMVVDVFKEGVLRVERPDRDFLLGVKAGQYPLEEVLQMAEDRLEELGQWADKCLLPKTIDPVMVERLLVEMRETLYSTA